MNDCTIERLDRLERENRSRRILNIGAQNGLELTKRFVALERRVYELETRIREMELRRMAEGWGGK